MNGARKKICFVNTCRSWGGGEKWHLEAALSVDPAKFDPHILAAPGTALSERARHAGLPVFTAQVGNLSFLDPFLIQRLKRFFLREGFHAVVLNLPSDLKTSGRAAKTAGVPNIIYRRGSAIPIKNSALNRFLFSRVITGMIANSEATKKCILANNPDLIEKEKIKVIRNGLDTKLYHVVKHAEKQKLVFGNLGRLVEQKGQEMLIEIAKKLDGYGVDFQMRIGGSGPLHGKLEKKTKQAGLGERIRLVGHVAGPAAFMQALDVFLLPSRWEGFGYVIAEAMASGLPVVAFDVSSNPELVRHGETGFLAQAFDTGAFAQYAARLAADVGLRRQMGGNARKVVRSRYSIQESTERLEAMLY